MAHQLAPGERVIVFTRPQARTLVLPAAAFVLIPALCAFGVGWLLRHRAEFDPAVAPWVPVAAWVIVAVGLVLLLWCSLKPLARWLSTHYLLTNWRLTIRHGWLRRREQESHLVAIRQIGITQTLLQRVLRCGNITLDLGHGRTTTYVDIPEVAKFRSILTRCIEQLPHSAMFDGFGLEPGYEQGQELDGIGRSPGGGFRFDGRRDDE